MSINVHNEELTYLRLPIITCLNIDFCRIKLQQIVLFGINLCLRLGICKPSQYHLDALKKKNGAARQLDATAYVRWMPKGITNYVCMGHISWGQMGRIIDNNNRNYLSLWDKMTY